MINELKKIVFIVDGGPNLGLGHVYQSISLAKLIDSIADVVFLTQSSTKIVDIITTAGFNACKLSSDSEILNYIYANKPSIVIMDNTYASVEIARGVKTNSYAKLIIFTNLSNANRYADIAVTADLCHFNNIRFMNYDTNTLYFYGPKYWILREEFYKYSKKNKPIPKAIDKILITFGGSDPSNLTALVLQELIDLPNNPTIDVILGSSFTHFESLAQVEKEYISRRNPINILKNINNMSNLMFKADLVIASPGLSAFEALLVGTPILLIPQDQIQRETYRGFIKVVDKENVGDLLQDIENMNFTFPNQEDIINMRIGQGAEEIVNEILNLLEFNKE